MEIRFLDKTAADTDFEQVQSLFRDMHAYMDMHGLSHALVPDGEQLWLRALKPTLGRLNHLIVAQSGDEVLGFAHGSIRFLPEYLGGKKGGFVAFVYVKPEKRHLSVGKKLIEALEQKFVEQSVDFIDLDVLSANELALAFWRSMGYTPSMLRMEKKSLSVK